MKVVKAPDPRLRITTKQVKKINSSLENTTREMIKLTKSFTDPEGVGLASTQIGFDGCFFVAKINDAPKKKGVNSKQFNTFINPQILSASEKTKTYFEGCLSIPEYFGEVNRSLSIKVSYQDLTGKKIAKTLKGINAWIFQHEVDHLNGILFPDRVLQQKSKFYKLKGRDETGTDIFEEVTI